MHLRVSTYAPFRLQFYCYGHSWLARLLTAEGIGYTMADPDRDCSDYDLIGFFGARSAKCWAIRD